MFWPSCASCTHVKAWAAGVSAHPCASQRCSMRSSSLPSKRFHAHGGCAWRQCRFGSQKLRQFCDLHFYLPVWMSGSCAHFDARCFFHQIFALLLGKSGLLPQTQTRQHRGRCFPLAACRGRIFRRCGMARRWECESASLVAAIFSRSMGALR